MNDTQRTPNPDRQAEAKAFELIGGWRAKVSEWLPRGARLQAVLLTRRASPSDFTELEKLAREIRDERHRFTTMLQNADQSIRQSGVATSLRKSMTRAEVLVTDLAKAASEQQAKK